MVLDGSGITHISYVENGRLVYTTNGEGEWVSATLYADEEVRVSWMSVDREGYLHIIFSTPRSSFSKLWYAANTSGDWLIEPFEVVGAVRIADFVIDEEGVMHLIHVFCADDDDGPCWLYYTTNATDEWVTETVDISMSLTAGAHSLAVDRNGKAHISYHQYRPGGLQKYATNPAGKWNIETLEAGGHDGSALALDDAGNAYIAYTMNYSIRYASNASGKWTAETVDTGGRDLRLLSPSLGLDGKGRAHIAYHRWSLSRGDLKYATNLSGDWLMETVDAGGYTGSRPSLALDHDGRVHIAYIDYANRARTLRYAQAISCGPPWSN